MYCVTMISGHSKCIGTDLILGPRVLPGTQHHLLIAYALIKAHNGRWEIRWNHHIKRMQHTWWSSRSQRRETWISLLLANMKTWSSQTTPFIAYATRISPTHTEWLLPTFSLRHLLILHDTCQVSTSNYICRGWRIMPILVGHDCNCILCLAHIVHLAHPLRS